jgi:oxidase EvaA
MINGETFVSQPIIRQNEVGYLGFIGKEINGVLHFLMQAKIEPGNVNNVQISPTIQATKSNFTQKHGGKRPDYLDYFVNVGKYDVVYDGEEPEQCSRFLQKFNRNVVIIVKDQVPVLPNFCWMTIGQIKELMTNHKNLVNMDTRTVLSCLPYELGQKSVSFSYFLRRSIFGEDLSDALVKCLYTFVKKAKYERKVVRLDLLNNWTIDPWGLRSKTPFPFSVSYYNIEIQGREVNKWSQPMMVAEGMAFFGLVATIVDDSVCFLIKIKQEIGCAQTACFGPTVQLESTELTNGTLFGIDKLFMSLFDSEKNIVTNVILSEEGGRFYHEENRNVILLVDRGRLPEKMPDGYFLVNYNTIRNLISKYHIVNIQLRNLLSLVKDNYGKAN